MILCGFEELQNHFVNGNQLLLGRHAIGAALKDATLRLPHKPSDSNHEELFQVGAEDGKKLHPLKQGILVIVSLLKHPVLEG
jgi:hypothetical protein